MFTDLLRRCAKDIDRPHPFKDSTTNHSTGWRGFVMSCLDETAMNEAQELYTYNDLYNYDVLVKLLSDRFDPASRVSAFRSRFHGQSRRHHEDADTFADALSELCRVGYPQSPPELRQELIAEQFVRGQSDPELKKYLWVVIRTQKDRKLQTLIEVCTDFSSLMVLSQLHPPAEQTYAVHQEVETYPEDEGELEDMFAVGDRPPWNNRRSPEPSTSKTLQQMFALARRMGYEMRPIARQTDGSRPLQEIDRSRIRIGGSAIRHVPVGTIPESSASVVVSLDICGHDAHCRTLPCLTNLWVGNSNLIIINNGMAITNRETHHRPGPHPHRSVFTSFEPHAIIMHHIGITPLITGYFDHPYSSSAKYMYINMLIDRRSESCEVTGGASERRCRENIGTPSSSSGSITKSKPYYTGDTLRRPDRRLLTFGG